MQKKSLYKTNKIFLTLLFTVLLNTSIVWAASESSTTSLKNEMRIFNNDIKFTMPVNDSSHWFSLPNGIVLEDECYINLHISYSNTLIDNLSDITVLINDIPIDTKWISDLKKSTTGWWKVKIPVAKIKSNGANKLSIQSRHRSIEGDCADIDNDSNWVLIQKDSYIQMPIQRTPSPSLGNVYSLYYDFLLNKKILSSDFILADTSKDSANALLKLASAVGRNYPDRQSLNYGVFKGNAVTPVSQNRIFIGPLSSWTSTPSVLLPKDTIANEQGFISISEITKDYPWYSLLLSGGNAVGLRKSIDFFSNAALMDQVTSKAMTVDSTVLPEGNSFKLSEAGLYKFSDLGYPDLKMHGAFHQKSSISFLQPKGMQSGKGSYINIKFNHSKALLPDRSIITVYINGTAVNSSKLTNTNAENGTLKVMIPEEALKTSRINVDIECYNYLGKVDCSKDYSDSAWTVVSSNSEIFLEATDLGIKPSLENFPFFYSGKDKKKEPEEIIFNIPDNISENYLNIAAMLATRAGQNTGSTFNWNVATTSDKLTDNKELVDMIFMGTYNNIKLPEEISKQLPITFLGNNKFNINEKLQATAETLKDKVILQVIRSPWNFYKRIYVITYEDEKNLEVLKKVLSDSEYLWEINNQVTLIDSLQGVHSFKIQEDEVIVSPKTIMDRIKFLEQKTGLPIWLFAGIIFLILAGLIAIRLLTKEKNEFEKTGRKLKEEQGFLTKEDERKANSEQRRLTRMQRKSKKK